MLVSLDATYVITGAMYWSVIELNIGILAASIPSMKPIASRYAPRLLGSSFIKSGNKSSSYLKSNTGFKSSGLGRSNVGTMELQSMERSDRFGQQSVGHRTEIGKGNGTVVGKSALDDNSSEEVRARLMFLFCHSSNLCGACRRIASGGVLRKRSVYSSSRGSVCFCLDHDILISSLLRLCTFHQRGKLGFKLRSKLTLMSDEFRL